MLAQLLVSLSGLVDRAMVGRLSTDGGAAVPLAAVGYATQLFFLIQSALFAVGLACVALMARAIGAGDRSRARRTLGAALQVAVGVSLLFTAGIAGFAHPLLRLLGAEAAVTDAAAPYLRLIVGASVMLAVSLTLDSALRANRDTRTPMWIAVAVTAVKLTANWAFIFGHWGAPRLELLGAGVATALSQIVGLALFLTALRAQAHDSPLRLRPRDLLSSGELRRAVVRIAAPGIAERVVMNAALLTYFWVLGRYYGTVQVAAYTVGVAVLSFSWIPGIGYAQACAALVGQTLGAESVDEARRTGWRAARMALFTALFLGFVFALGREPLARLFTEDAQVVHAMGPFMLAVSLAQPFLQLHFTLGGAHRGAGDTWTPLVAATVGNWVFRVPLACLCAIVLEADVVWVWSVLFLDHVARAALLGWSFRRGRWSRKRL